MFQLVPVEKVWWVRLLNILNDIPIFPVLHPLELAEPVVVVEIDNFWLSWLSLVPTVCRLFMILSRLYPIYSFNSIDYRETLKFLMQLMVLIRLTILSNNCLKHILYSTTYLLINNHKEFISSFTESLFVYIITRSLSNLVPTSREVPTRNDYWKRTVQSSQISYNLIQSNSFRLAQIHSNSLVWFDGASICESMSFSFRYLKGSGISISSLPIFITNRSMIHLWCL